MGQGRTHTKYSVFLFPGAAITVEARSRAVPRTLESCMLKSLRRSQKGLVRTVSERIGKERDGVNTYER